MLTQGEAERGLVFSLLRRPGEDGMEVLERMALLPVAVEPEDIADMQLRSLMAVVLENGGKEVSTSTRLAAQATGMDEFDLIQGVESVDPNALNIYAYAVQHHSLKRAVASAAEDAVEAARSLSPREALDRINTHFSGISTASEDDRIGTINQRIEEGRQALIARQQSMSNGEERVSFPMAGLNRMVPYLLTGQMILVTGQTGFKGSWLGLWLYDANIKRGLRGVYFHFEDTPEVMDLRRIARQMARYGAGGVALRTMLANILTVEQWEKIEEVRNSITEWGEQGTEVYAAGWSMEQVCRVWWRLCMQAKAAGDPIDFVVVDYLNKAELSPQKLRAYGLYAARGRDAELVKRTSEATGAVSFLVQQEGVDGHPYETKQSWQKSQGWISLQRERLPDQSLSPTGQVVVKNANMGSTGAVQAEFIAKYMLWKGL